MNFEILYQFYFFSKLITSFIMSSIIELSDIDDYNEEDFIQTVSNKYYVN